MMEQIIGFLDPAVWLVGGLILWFGFIREPLSWLWLKIFHK
jgi:hypothetical protein